MILSLLKILFAILNTAFVATLELIITPFHRTGKLFHTLARFWAYGTLKVCGVKVIVEGRDKFSRFYKGKSHNYLSVILPDLKDNLVGKMVVAQIKTTNVKELIGEVIKKE